MTKSMSFTVSPAAARPRMKVSSFFWCHSGRAVRSLSLPMQLSTRMVWRGVFTM